MGKLSAIKQLELKAKMIPGVISLAQGMPSLPSDKRVRNAAITAIKEGLCDKYSAGNGIPELREMIARRFRRDDMSYDPNNEILVTAGSIESLSAILLSLLSHNDEVLTITPTYYANYRSIVEMAGGTIVPVQLDEKNEWNVTVSAFKKKISKKTRVILLCNPNNPTGSIIPEKTLREIADMAVSRNLLLIIDDVYGDLYFDTDPVWHPAMDKKYKQNTIRIVSFSKIFSLAGWRIGCIHGPEKYISQLLAVHDNLINCAPAPSQYAALEALRHYDEIALQNRQQYQEHRTIMANALTKLSKYVSFVMPKGAYYFFPKIHNCVNDEKLCYDILEKVGVAVVPGSDFGPGGKGHVRLCFGKSKQEIKEGMKRLSLYFSKYASDVV